MKKNFEDHLIRKGDEIDNAAYALAIALLRTSPEQSRDEILPWNMSVIAPVVDGATEALKNAVKVVCRPYYEDEIPCHETDTCSNQNCFMKTN